MAPRPVPRRKAGPRATDARTGDLFDPSAGAPAAIAEMLPPPHSRAAPVPAQLWLAVQLTALPLVVASGTPPMLPGIVVGDEGGARTVIACNAAALAAGLAAGLGINAARARVPALAVWERDPVRERRRFAALARWALAFTPFVSLEPPDSLLLEVRGSLGLFGGLEALVARIEAGLRDEEQPATLGIAPTARAALWLARAAPAPRAESAAGLAGALARLPLAATRWPARTLEDCTRLGVSVLGELRRLPREGLARRFTPALLAELDEAYGLRPAPRRRYVAPERFEERLDLPVELQTTTALLPYCGRLLEALEQHLRARAVATASLAFTLLHRDGRPGCIRLGRAQPATQAAEWHALLAERLGRTTLAAPVRALVLRSGPAVPAASASGALAGCGPDAAAAEAGALHLLDRLRARLGDAAVSGVCLVPEHRPEAAFRRQRPELGARASLAAALPATPRPLWLLGEAEPLAARQGRPEWGGALVLESGPERIESGWWEGGAVSRDYYVARTVHGARLWVYRAATGGWFLHGVFG
jgi:protein ImuB